MKDRKNPALGNRAMRFFYGTAAGRVMMQLMLRSGAPRLMAAYMHSRFSKGMVRRYIRRYDIPMDDFKEQKFRNFASFFVREKACPVDDPDPSHLISPCDGLLSAFPIEENGSFAIKNSHYRLCDLVDDRELAEEYRGGLCLIFRLRANDYHRYAFVADGYIGQSHYIEGQLHSVQPIACEQYPVYRLNRRCWHLLETEEFGPLIQVEVGAMAVGGIVTEIENARFSRGQEMGHFELCGSTIVLWIQKDRVALRQELWDALQKQSEIEVHRGMWIGEKTTASRLT